MSIIDYSELTYKRPNVDLYTYPKWAVGIGWAIAALSAVCIPITAVYKTVKYLAVDGKVISIHLALVLI